MATIQIRTSTQQIVWIIGQLSLIVFSGTITNKQHTLPLWGWHRKGNLMFDLCFTSQLSFCCFNKLQDVQPKWLFLIGKRLMWKCSCEVTIGFKYCGCLKQHSQFYVCDPVKNLLCVIAEGLRVIGQLEALQVCIFVLLLLCSIQVKGWEPTRETSIKMNSFRKVQIPLVFSVGSEGILFFHQINY